MLNVLDIILLALILLIIVISAVKGIIITLFDIASSVGSILIAKAISSPIATEIYNSFIKKKTVELLAKKIGETSGSVVESIKSAIDSLPKVVNSYLCSVIDTNSLNGFSVDSTASEIEEKIFSPVLTRALELLSMIAVSILLMLVFKIVSRIISKGIKNTKILNSTDHILGLVFGILKSIIYVLFFIFVLNCLSDCFESVATAVDGSVICKFLRSINK